jgi:hypothetical protein
VTEVRSTPTVEASTFEEAKRRAAVSKLPTGCKAITSYQATKDWRWRATTTVYRLDR